MKATELRIGNYIYLELGLPSLNIHKMHPTDFENIDNDPRVIPIPLTEEWLTKFGFDYDAIAKMYWIDLPARMQLRFVDCNTTELDLYQDSKIISFKHNHCQYVHQLQNLFFALTGRELTIKQ
jgi:hypothetical protein